MEQMEVIGQRIAEHPVLGSPQKGAPVSFLFDGKEMPARLFVTLATKDANSHQDALMSVYEIFGDEDKLEEVLKSPDADTLYSFFDQ